jgi:metal-sulfur cluster biosynthetic enzyme/ribosomal protein L22
MTMSAVVATREEQVRVVTRDAQLAISAITGLSAVRAVAKLRLGPGRTCEPVARVIDRALARATSAGLKAEQLVVTGGSASAAEDIVRVRRKAHGKADWISSPTTDVYLELRPAGLADSSTDLKSGHNDGLSAGPGTVTVPVQPEPPADPPVPAVYRQRPKVVEAIRQQLYDVIDPDLGVNIVDLGFIRDIWLDDAATAVITMTLTSAACPLTRVMTDQVRQVLLASDVLGVSDVRVAWSWVPAWLPADITDDGRDQLRAIGFSNF